MPCNRTASMQASGTSNGVPHRWPVARSAVKHSKKLALMAATLGIATASRAGSSSATVAVPPCGLSGYYTPAHIGVFYNYAIRNCRSAGVNRRVNIKNGNDGPCRLLAGYGIARGQIYLYPGIGPTGLKPC